MTITKPAICADLHIWNHNRWAGVTKSGVNARAREALAVVSRTYELARQNGCDAMFILGDAFDRAGPGPQLLAAFREIMLGAGMPTFLIVGNHDQVSDAEGDHALNPLEWPRWQPQSGIKIIEKPTVIDGFALIPHQSGPAKDWLPVALKKLGPGFHTLMLHLGIADTTTNPFLKGSDDSVQVSQLTGDLARQYGYGHVFAGNWHDRRTWTQGNVAIHQLGTLIPHTFSDAGLNDRGSFAVKDGQDVHHVPVPGPRFVQYRDDVKLRELDEQRALGNALYVRVTVAPKYFTEARQHLREMVDTGLIHAGEAVARKVEATTIANPTVRFDDSVDAALIADVKKRDLQDLNPARILKLVRGFLKEAKS